MPGIARFTFAPVLVMFIAWVIHEATFGYGFTVLGLLIAPALFACAMANGNRIVQVLFGIPALISLGALVLGALYLAETNGYPLI